MTDNQITLPEELRKLLRYEPETGRLFWLPRPADMFATKRAFSTWNALYAGAETFTTPNEKGYLTGVIFGRIYRAHRVALAIHTGAWPADEVDHINGVKSDNRLKNLRKATHAENSRNRGVHKDNSSGVKGVCWHKVKKKWHAVIMCDRSRVHLGYYDNINDAAEAYAKAAIKLHGDFARLS